jgi:hypothetical protein
MTGWWILWGACCAGLAWLTVRALREATGVVDDALAGDGHDVGPDSLRLLEDADLHLNQCAAFDSDLWAAFAPGAPIPDLTEHPDADAGFDRLRQAIRDHREEEEA